MRILDRYITKSIILIFLGTVIVFSMLYIIIDTASNLDEFIDRKVPVSIIVQYYITYLPIMLVETAAISCLIAILTTFSNLNTHNEIIAFRSSGMSFWQIARPALHFAFFVCVLIFVINERVVPSAKEASKKIRNENIILEVDRQRKKKTKISNLTFYGLKNRLYYVMSFDPNTYEMEGISITGYDEKQNIKEKVDAFQGKWTGIAWKFYQCKVQSFQSSIYTPTQIRFYDEKLMDIKETPEDFMNQRLDTASMNIRQLYGYITRFKNSGAEKAINNLWVDFNQKIAYPFSGFVIVLVGLPLVLMTGRRKAQNFFALGIAVIVGFLFHVFYAVGLALGKGGLFPPVVAAWLAPAIFTCIALYLIKTRFG